MNLNASSPNVNLFGTLAGTKAKTMLRWVEAVIQGKKPGCYRQVDTICDYFGVIDLPTLGHRLARCFQALRILPMLTADRTRVDFISVQGLSATTLSQYLELFRLQWGVEYPAHSR